MARRSAPEFVDVLPAAETSVAGAAEDARDAGAADVDGVPAVAGVHEGVLDDRFGTAAVFGAVFHDRSNLPVARRPLRRHPFCVSLLLSTKINSKSDTNHRFAICPSYKYANHGYTSHDGKKHYNILNKLSQ